MPKTKTKKKWVSIPFAVTPEIREALKKYSDQYQSENLEPLNVSRFLRDLLVSDLVGKGFLKRGE